MTNPEVIEDEKMRRWSKLLRPLTDTHRDWAFLVEYPKVSAKWYHVSDFVDLSKNSKKVLAVTDQVDEFCTKHRINADTLHKPGSK
jgi:hypothetical protein